MTFDLRRLIEARRKDDVALLERHLNPWIVRMLRAAGCNTQYVRAEGATLVDAQGREYLDLFGGYGVFLLGRNHPTVVRALGDALALGLPNLVQLDAPLLAGLVAERLTARAPWLSKVFFCNSGTEAVEASLKLACAATGRSRIVRVAGSFHGLTTGALSLGEPEYTKGYEDLLFEATSVAAGDTAGLEEAFRGDDVAAFVFEPILGVTVSPLERSFVARAAELCVEHDALLVADEVQTGCGRSGPFFAFESLGVEPDIVLVSKGLSGGLVPVGAAMTRPDIFESIFSLEREVGLHGCTFSKNSLSMVAALATLEVIESELLLARGEALGVRFREALRSAAERLPAIKSLRGRGCMIGIELDRAVFPAGAQHLAIRLLKEHRILAQPTGAPDHEIVKLLPPLNADPSIVDTFVDALTQVLEGAAPHAARPSGAGP